MLFISFKNILVWVKYIQVYTSELQMHRGCEVIQKEIGRSPLSRLWGRELNICWGKYTVQEADKNHPSAENVK